MTEIRLYHKMLLNHLKDFVEDYYFAQSCDYGTEVNDYYYITTLMEISKVLLWNKDLRSKIVKVNEQYEWYEYKCISIF